MNPTLEIFRRAESFGLRLEACGGNLAVSPSKCLKPDFADELRRHKGALLNFLKSRADGLATDCARPPSPIMQISPAQFVPRNPDEFIGSAAKIAKVLANKADELRKASKAKYKILLYGPPGTGKTELAKMLASQLTEHPTSVESINGRNLRIDSVRAWQESARYRPMYGLFNVKIVNELDTVPPESQDLLLTFLDEMPELTAFIGTSNHLGKFEERFRTRLQRFDVNTPNVEQLIELLRRWGLPASTVKQIAVRSKGNVRDALLEAQTFLDGQLVNGAEPKRWR
jgi:replication-associated recombination protein RarA